jgi:hypothetical protein
MKRVLVLVFLLATATAANATSDYSGWSWQRHIPVGPVSGFVRLPITPEVFDQSQPTLNDLRVLDTSRSLVPHVLHWGRVRDISRTEWLIARLLNETYVPAMYSRVTVDFGDMVEKNRLKVNLSQTNYRRRALLEGSNDSKTWEVVAEDQWLFNVSMQGRNFMLDTLKFPVNNFRYLRLTAYNMSDDPRRISIESVKSAFSRTESKKELVEVPVQRIRTTQDRKRKQSIFEFDLGFRNMPLVIMECEISTPYFHRGFELYGRNQATEEVRRKTENGWKTVERKVPWRSVKRGILYRTRYKKKTNESVKIEGFRAPYRYLQLRVFNGDNPPLQLSQATLFRRDTSLVFSVKARETYALIGGNSKVRAPDYDLARAVRGVDDFSLPVVHAGETIALRAPEKKKLPWSERHSGLILAVLVAAVGVMLVFILKNLKKLPAERGEE